MRKKYRIRRSFHISTMMAISIISVAVVGISIVGFSLSKLYSHFLRIDATASNEETIAQINKNIDFYISDIISVGDYTKKILSPDSDYTLSEIKISLEALKDSHKDITGIGVFDLNGNPLLTTSNGVLSSRGIKNEDWFKKAIESDEYVEFFSVPHRQNLSISVRDSVISYSRKIKIRSIESEDPLDAILLIDLNLLAISEITEHGFSDHNDEYIYVISSDGTIIYHPKMLQIVSGEFIEDLDSISGVSEGNFTSVFNGKERLTVIEPIAKTGWKIVGVENMDEVMDQMRAFHNIIVITYIFIIVITIIISRLIARNITEPIRQLEEIMREVQVGNFAIVPPHEGTKEVQSLSNSFSIMIDKIKKLMDDIKRTEAIKRQRELDALQAKINPHFLYNTLETIIWMAETGDSKGVVKTVSALASLFRISISKGHDVITLQEELNHVSCYLDIQLMRYKDKFDYSISIPEDLKNCPTIKLIIQPIVENSIYHGIKYLQDKGHISICVEKAGNDIEIRIQDNGVGMDSEKAAAILDPNADIERSGNGIGLMNIDERLKLSYGSHYGLSIWSEREEGTTVIVTIPHLDPITPILIKPVV